MSSFLSCRAYYVAVYGSFSFGQLQNLSLKVLSIVLRFKYIARLGDSCLYTVSESIKSFFSRIRVDWLFSEWLLLRKKPRAPCQVSFLENWTLARKFLEKSRFSEHLILWRYSSILFTRVGPYGLMCYYSYECAITAAYLNTLFRLSYLVVYIHIYFLRVYILQFL